MADLGDLLARAQNVERESYNNYWMTLVETSELLQELSPRRRRPWLTSVVQEMYRQQEGLCALCSGPLEDNFEVDHKIPFCYGGGNERGNIQLAHTTCNRQKRTQVSPEDLLRCLEDLYMNR